MAVKQEKGELARTSGEKPHGEEEVSCSPCCLAWGCTSTALWQPRLWPRPSLKGQEAQLGLQAAPLCRLHGGTMCSDLGQTVLFPSLGASR